MRSFCLKFDPYLTCRSILCNTHWAMKGLCDPERAKHYTAQNDTNVVHLFSSTVVNKT